MAERILVRGGKVVTPEGVFPADVLTLGERIFAVGDGLPLNMADEVIDASGCFVLPGVIDPHVHIQLDTGIYQTRDDWEVGTKAAACGGVTTVLDFATQFKGQTLEEALENRWNEIDGKAVIDYGLHVMVTDLPAGEEDEIATLSRLGAPTAKVYTTYRPNYYMDDDQLLRTFKAAAKHDVMVMVHAENDAIVSAATERLIQAGKTDLRYHGDARPMLAEQEAAHRVAFLAAEADARVYVVHNSTARTSEILAEARGKGADVIAETCPQYLILDDSLYRGEHPEWVILQPPLRPKGQGDRLWELLAQGVVSTVGTDHCDYTLEQKVATMEFPTTPGGIPGLETSLRLMYTHGVVAGRISLSRLVEVMSYNPARIFGLYPRKGTIQPGSDADIVVYDPEPEETITASRLHTIGGYTPYEGMKVKGAIKAVLSRGMPVCVNGEFTGQVGRGRYVERRIEL